LEDKGLADFPATIREACRLLGAGEISSVELTKLALRRIHKLDGELHAYLTLNEEGALKAAERSDERRREGKVLSNLDGIPYGAKDVLATEGVRTTCGSRNLENYIPPFTATAVARLEAAGAVMLGKTNCDEYAMGSSTENSAYGPTRNPWDPSYVPGGSSGGSAAAMAARMGLFTLGTDTGGSIRQPASLCGVTGLKPTYGRVSRYGLVAFASSLDQIGPFTVDAYDAAMVMEVIAGYDPCDSTSAREPVPPYSSDLEEGGVSLAGVRVGLPTEFWGDGLSPQMRVAVTMAVRELESLGADLVEVSLPYTDYALAAYYIIAPAEASSNLARFDGMKYGYRDPEALSSIESMLATREYGFGPEVKRRIMLGTYVLSAGYYDAYYKKAQQVRTLIAQDFDNALSGVDVLVGPTSPSVAFPIGEKTEDPLAMYLNDVYTVPANLAGISGISIPCGFVDSLPVGLQLLGRRFGEPAIFRIAHAYQQVTDHHLNVAPLAF
jgi:aspartyl-tRNA(Asn)/glutamyl-tRNA(Gln) amidotransferase subunit A